MLTLRKKNTNIAAHKDTLILLTASLTGAERWLSAAEKSFVKKRIKEKTETIPLNRLTQQLFIQIIPAEKNIADKLERLRKDGCKMLSLLNEGRIKSAVIIDCEGLKEETLAFCEGMLLGSYRFDRYLKDKKKKKIWPADIFIHSRYIGDSEIAELNILCDAVFRARNLINEPVNHLNARQLGAAIRDMGKESGFQATLLNKRKIESLRMGGLLAVNRGSIDEPVFTIMEWKPAQAHNKKPVVIVGKGITFDTGGLSLKPTPDSMDYMKSDMSGAAATAGILYVAARMRMPVHLIGLVPCTDNRPHGNATAPGDIIRMMDGTTVEILNTDAEGRLILADALTYAKRYQPSLVITLATLTGAAAAALGKHAIAGMGNAGKKFTDKLIESGFRVHERIAMLPFWDDYKEMLKSDVADLQNIGGKYAGAITAGKFLEHFTDYPFIHLDIAGVAFSKENDSYRGKGGTGIGIRLIYDFLKNINNKQL